jgi:hypothetical protein
VFALHLTLYGRAIPPTEHETLADMGDALASAFDEAGMRLTPRALTVLLSMLSRDLHAHLTWTWDAEDYQIFVARDGADL